VGVLIDPSQPGLGPGQEEEEVNAEDTSELYAMKTHLRPTSQTTTRSLYENSLRQDTFSCPSSFLWVLPEMNALID